ncbi:MAG: hypothetical protein E7458_09110 [Ruminococcaceae bacterium]|nr:hypothetical protein [Oscillospiraceae bacterium]
MILDLQELQLRENLLKYGSGVRVCRDIPKDILSVLDGRLIGTEVCQVLHQDFLLGLVLRNMLAQRGKSKVLNNILQKSTAAGFLALFCHPK